MSLQLESPGPAPRGTLLEELRPAASRESERRWYGWKLLATDLASIGLVVGGVALAGQHSNDQASLALAVAGAAGIVFGGPAWHALSEGQLGRAGVSLALRTVPLVAGFAIASLAGQSCHGDDICGPAVLSLFAGLVVEAIGILSDDFALAWKDQPAPPDALVPARYAREDRLAPLRLARALR